MRYAERTLEKYMEDRKRDRAGRESKKRNGDKTEKVMGREQHFKVCSPIPFLTASHN